MFTQAHLDAIDEAIASGALTVKYSDKEVTYGSFDDLMKRRRYIAGQLGLVPTTGLGNTKFGEFDKGLFPGVHCR